MSIDADALRALGERATGGNWTHRPWTTGDGHVVNEDREIMSDGGRTSVADSLSVDDADFLTALVSAYRSGDLIHRSKISEETARAGEAMRKRCLGLVQVEIDAVSRVEDDLIATGGENDSLSYAGHRASLQMMEAAIRALPLTEETAHVER